MMGVEYWLIMFNVAYDSERPGDGMKVDIFN